MHTFQMVIVLWIGRFLKETGTLPENISKPMSLSAKELVIAGFIKEKIIVIIAPPPKKRSFIHPRKRLPLYIAVAPYCTS